MDDLTPAMYKGACAKDTLEDDNSIHHGTVVLGTIYIHPKMFFIFLPNGAPLDVDESNTVPSSKLNLKYMRMQHGSKLKCQIHLNKQKKDL